MKGLLIILTIVLASCEMPQPEPHREIVWTPIIVKKKYSENSVTKDVVFGTGNWHSTDYYIVDTKNKVWTGIYKNDFIVCNIGDTLWTNDGWSLQLIKTK